MILVDLPPTIGKNMLFAVGNVTSQPITYMVYSYSHADHIGVASLVAGPGKPAEIIAHEDTKKLLQEVPDAAPHHHIQGRLQALCGATRRWSCAMTARTTPAVTSTSTRRRRSCSSSSTSFPPAGSPRVPGRIAAHDKVLAYDSAHHVGGHLGQAGTRADVLVRKECMQGLFASCKQALDFTATGGPLSGAAVLQGAVELVNPGNPRAVFRGYLAVVAGYCGDATNKKWVGR